MYADDCKIFRKISSVNDHDILQNDLDELHSWTLKWGLKLNIQKCKYIIFVFPKKHRRTMISAIE